MVSNQAAIYARYSSDNQREESIEAQVRAIKEYYGREGIEAVSYTHLDVYKRQVCNAILNGEVVELQDHGRDVKVLFQPATKEKPDYFVLVAAAYEQPEVVTVERALEDVWKFLDSYAIRKRRS